ncbi:MAG: C39 family peptidase [bacterium]|nr:C39 family peptidase [bacterium]
MWYKYIILVLMLSLSFASPVFSVSLDVPFTVQAPDANWSQPWQDACEETAIAIVNYFYLGDTFTTNKAKEAILQIIDIREKFIGVSLDENAETITKIINNFLTWEAHIVKNPTLEQIKAEIDANRPVIMPVHGKYLYNPYFKNGGPDYHSIVISGYDEEKQEFIVQEPGTRYGLDFRYSYDTIVNAMHDFLPDQKTRFGEKVAIFTSPIIKNSANSDGDEDGLSKADEIKYSSILYDPDTDKDGYNDGYEVSNAYLPTTSEPIQILIGTLIKSANSPMIYLIQNGIKRHIANEEVFLRHGWEWYDIFPVSQSFIDNLTTGTQITQ